MSNIFNSVPKYAGKYEVIKSEVLDAEDLASLEPLATIVKSTWGKSFVFTTKVTHYQMYIPADTEVDLQIGVKVPLEDLIIVTLHKEGEKDIQRVRVVKKARL